MMETLEFQGKNIEHALEKASQELQLPVEKIKHEVVTYGSTGIFGLVGIKKAIIKVFVDAPPEAPEVPEPHAADAPAAEPTEHTAEDASGAPTPPGEAIDDRLVDFAIMALQKIVDSITTGATVDLAQREGRLQLDVSGGESGVIIGKRGQTLEAIQYLLEKMVNKKSSNRIRVLVDVEGYLAKRKTNLQQLATNMAEKAKRTRKPMTIGQMNAHDRRIVHIHLKDDNAVRTQSVGDGYYRKLMIFPKKQGGPRRKKQPDKI